MRKRKRRENVLENWFFSGNFERIILGDGMEDVMKNAVPLQHWPHHTYTSSPLSQINGAHTAAAAAKSKKQEGQMNKSIVFYLFLS
jgi:hypothetical protein